MCATDIQRNSNFKKKSSKMADVSPLVSLTSDLLFEINREYPNVGSLDFSNNKISKIENMNVLQSLEELYVGFCFYG